MVRVVTEDIDEIRDEKMSLLKKTANDPIFLFDIQRLIETLSFRIMNHNED